MNSIWFIGLVCLSAVYVNADRGELKKYCGDNLVSTLALLCKGKYKTLVKRNEAYDEMSIEDYLYEMDDREPRWPVYPGNRLDSLSPRFDTFFRLRRTVTRECCEKPCTVTQLERYCA